MLGLLFGVCLLIVLILPLQISSYTAESAESFRQQNLIPGKGDAIADFHTLETSVFVLLNGVPHDGMSVSPDSMKWYTPQNGSISLELPPAEYKFCAAFDNRSVSATHRVGAGSPDELVLDVGFAPQAPGLLMLEGIKDEIIELPLDITNADSARLENPPNGLSVIRQGASFSLVVDGELLPYGFHAVEVKSENQYGKSITWIGLRIPRDTTPTPIYTMEDLNNIRYNLSGSYIVMNDLDMSDIHDWQPIGEGSYPFTGIFDGNGYEITGFHFMGTVKDGTFFSLFGAVKNGEIRNLIVREPVLEPANVENEKDGTSVIASANDRGLIESCAVIGGRVAPAGGGADGIIDGNSGIILSVFNSADIFCIAPNSALHNTGGIIGNNLGYGAYLANEGDVFGTHLAGGIVGWHHGGVIQKSVNSGYISGNTLVGEFPSGGIAHTVNDGAICAYSYFVRGEAAVGGKAFNSSIINSLMPINTEELRNPGSMAWLGSFTGDNPDWAFANYVNRGPVPYGIYKLCGFKDGNTSEGGSETP